MLTLVTTQPETSAETVRRCRLTHDSALLRLTGENATEADASNAFRTGVELGLALWAERRSRLVKTPADRYVVDALPSGVIRIQCDQGPNVEDSPRVAAEYLLRRLLGQAAVRLFAFELAQELVACGHWEVDREALVEWTKGVE